MEPGDSGDASNSDNENKDQNSGTDTSGADSSQGGDNSDAAGSGSNADNAGSSDSSDSSNGGDSADAGQGDTGSDSSNAEDTADAVSGEDAAQSEENTGDTGVLGVSRPRTAVNMSYQSEPVNAEAVDVTGLQPARPFRSRCLHFPELAVRACSRHCDMQLLERQ